MTMGFFRDLFGGDDSGSAAYNPATYTTTTTIGAPNVTTNTTLSKSETPKEAEKPDTSEYDESERNRRRKNGVRGTFTHGMTDVSKEQAMGV